MPDDIRNQAEAWLISFVILALIIVPPFAINGLVINIYSRGILLTISLGLAFGLWSFVFQSLLAAASGMYEFEKLRIYRLQIRIKRDRKAGRLMRGNIVILLFLSVLAMTYSFAIMYGLIAVLDSSAFSTKVESFISALYFSALAITNSLQDGLLPVSDAARLLTIIEMALGMLYALFFFSYLAAFVREGRQS